MSRSIYRWYSVLLLVLVQSNSMRWVHVDNHMLDAPGKEYGKGDWRGAGYNGDRRMKGGGGGGIRRGELRNWPQTWFQLPSKRIDVFCSVESLWQPVVEGGCLHREWKIMRTLWTVSVTLYVYHFISYMCSWFVTQSKSMDCCAG